MQFMQHTNIASADQIDHQPTAGHRRMRLGKLRRPARLALLSLGIAASFLPLAGCEGFVFPWDQKPQPAVEDASLPGGPSVTRGRPNTPAPAIKSKTKPKAKKPATPPTSATPQTPATGPALAAEPGQPAPNGAEGAASDSAATTTGMNEGGTNEGGTTGDQIATLPGGQSGDQPADPAAHAGANRPADMIGRDENGIRALIGEPAKTRTEGSTTVWSYQKDGCSLDLFLFYDVKTGAQRVLSYEIKPNATDSNAIQACYDKFHNV
jgi:hypothetical protein